ncbi:hypothetical protein [Geothrix terrae]|uniref:hypothetical protein n=1 Tax=Geothrix terrae TaxID=2922720 RepID=UPI001FADBE6D|nr:hypothetical protein [Geothrix terrae]
MAALVVITLIAAILIFLHLYKAKKQYGNEYMDMVDGMMKKLGTNVESEEIQDLLDTLTEIREVHKGLASHKPKMTSEMARLIASIMLQKPTTASATKKEQLEIMIRNEAVLTAFAWRTAEGTLVPDLQMFELIKDGMSEEERKEYLSLKEKDKVQVEKGLNLAILAELKSK